MALQVRERYALTYRQYLVGKIVDCLYFYNNNGVRPYAEFCKKNVHLQSIRRPVLKITEAHISSDLKEELVELRAENPALFNEVMTDAVIMLYEICNKTRFNNLVERQYAKWMIV